MLFCPYTSLTQVRMPCHILLHASIIYLLWRAGVGTLCVNGIGHMDSTSVLLHNTKLTSVVNN